MIPGPASGHDRRAVVHVAGRGGGGSDPRLDRPHDLDDALAIGDEGLHPIAGANLRRRLRRRPVHEDVAALAQPRRERAGLHEAHRAQPAVDARLVGGAVFGHALLDLLADRYVQFVMLDTTLRVISGRATATT